MEIVLFVAFIAVVVVGSKLYKKRLAHMTPKSSSVGGNITVSGGVIPRHDDGSVTPPTKEGQNEM